MCQCQRGNNAGVSNVDLLMVLAAIVDLIFRTSPFATVDVIFPAHESGNDRYAGNNDPHCGVAGNSPRFTSCHLLTTQ
jgi:hypothetical protein